MLLTLFRCRKNVNVRNVLNTWFNTEATWIDSNLNASSIPSAITFTNTQHVIFYDLIDNLKRDASSDVDVKWSAHNSTQWKVHGIWNCLSAKSCGKCKQSEREFICQSIAVDSAQCSFHQTHFDSVSRIWLANHLHFTFKLVELYRLTITFLAQLVFSCVCDSVSIHFWAKQINQRNWVKVTFSFGMKKRIAWNIRIKIFR